MSNTRPTPPPAGVYLYSYSRHHCRICGEPGQHRNLPGEAPEHGSFVDGKWTPRHPVGSVNGHAAPQAETMREFVDRKVDELIEIVAPKPTVPEHEQAPAAPDTRTTVELQRDLAIATRENARLRDENERWCNRIKLLESQLRAMVDIAEGRRAP